MNYGLNYHINQFQDIYLALALCVFGVRVIKDLIDYFGG